MKALDEAFDRVNAVLLAGPAGTGKTRLALEYAKTHVNTHHETVCLLSKFSEAKHHINVQVDMDEVDLTAAE